MKRPHRIAVAMLQLLLGLALFERGQRMRRNASKRSRKLNWMWPVLSKVAYLQSPKGHTRHRIASCLRSAAWLQVQVQPAPHRQIQIQIQLQSGTVKWLCHAITRGSHALAPSLHYPHICKNTFFPQYHCGDQTSNERRLASPHSTRP